MTDGFYLYEFTNGAKDIQVWTRDGVEFHLTITDMKSLNSESIYLPGVDLAKSILKEAWSND